MDQQMITIKVYDETHNQEKDVECRKHLLSRYMKYFEKYLNEATSLEDIDISVHCDIKIFEWLISYIVWRDKLGIDNGKGPRPHPPFAARHV